MASPALTSYTPDQNHRKQLIYNDQFMCILTKTPIDSDKTISKILKCSLSISVSNLGISLRTINTCICLTTVQNLHQKEVGWKNPKTTLKKDG